ncbi:MAG: hypothetical protein ACE5FV_04950 [Woeseia sp.]
MVRRRQSLILSLAILLIAACGGGGGYGNSNNTGGGGPGVVAKGNRLLEIQTSEPANGDFAGAFNLAQSIGMDSASLSVDWNAIDIGTDLTAVPPTPIYANDPATDFLSIANGCYRNTNTRLSLMLRPITTLAKMAPPGFENVPFDDPAMIDRFKAFLDHVFAKIPDIDITALAIGSEVDLHLIDALTRQQYLSFYQQVSAYARTAYAQLYPGQAPLTVTVEVTHKGLLDPGTSAYYQQLNATSDAVGVSYYPLENGLVQDPGVVARHFADLLALYPSRNLHFFQLGYPSGYYSTAAYPEYAAGNVTPVINSSDVLQSDFIKAVFSAWDVYASRIDLISFTWMHDETEADVAAIIANPAFGGLTNPPPDFVEFLRTLGLRTDAATDKPAWTALADEAAARGWSDTGMQLTCN